MGQIAFALGFSSFTRGYFKTWLDYMVSAGMYIVVAAILMRLVTHSMVDAVHDAAALGLTTSGAAAQVFDLAFFVFLVSFEIPKIAGMFGGGANASGAVIGKIARSAAGAVV
jgi:type IV secretory pathway VirB6-like protein